MPKYDVFISFKKTDAQGNLTKDCEMARALYHAMEQHNIPTFFSEKLREKGEANFKKAIEKALADARLLVAVGTTLDNMEAPWVDKEINTFELQLLNRVKDPSKCTMVSYISPDFPPSQLPSGLSLRESFTELDALVDFILTFLKNGSGFVDQQDVKKNVTVDASSIEGKGIVINGRYQIIKEIGRGGFSQIFKARDIQTEKFVAAKVVEIQGDSRIHADVVQGLLEEANIMRELDHPQIPKIHEVIRYPDHSLIIIMDLVEGIPLNQVLREKTKLDEEIVILIARQLGDILHHLHTRPTPIIYRDLKPANIVLTSKYEIMLLDFGIARRYRLGRMADTTCLGTRGYAAPEQYGGMGQTDARTDIYALGVTMYHLLTGKDPVENPFSDFALPYSKSVLSYGLKYIIDTCVNSFADRRFQSAAEFLDALNDIEQISRRERRKALFRKIRMPRFRKTESAVAQLPISSSIPVNEFPPMAPSPTTDTWEETTILTDSEVTAQLPPRLIEEAEKPIWTRDMLKDALLKFEFTYFSVLGTTVSVRIDDVNSDSWKQADFLVQPAVELPPARKAGNHELSPVGTPQILPMKEPDDNKMSFTCDARAGDQLSITFENDALHSNQALHFLWIGKSCCGTHALGIYDGKDVAVTLWKNGEKVFTKTLQIVTPQQRKKQDARMRLQILATDAKQLHYRISREAGIVNLAPVEFVAAYYKNILETKMEMGNTQSVIPFLFVGAPCTGKTRMAQAIAKSLDRPFARIQPDSKKSLADQKMDMLFFLRRRSRPVLIFEEIEKADRSIVQFLMQLLSGSVPIESEGDFRLEDTIIIVTTCAGTKVLDPEYLDFPPLPRKRILEVLANEAAAEEDTCRFPGKLLTYTGWEKLIFFPPQTNQDLCCVAEKELWQCSETFREEYGVHISFDKEIMPLVLLSGDNITTTEQVKCRARDLFLDVALALIQDMTLNYRLHQLEHVRVCVDVLKDDAQMERFRALCKELEQSVLPKDRTAQVQYLTSAYMYDENQAVVSMRLK